MKNFLKKIIRAIRTFVVAVFWGLAKSFSHKVEYKEGQKKKWIEEEMKGASVCNVK